MKRRTMSYVASACVAGLVAGAPAVAFADTAGSDGVASGTTITQSEGAWSASENMNVDLYGPPAFKDEPVQALYGPPVVAEPVQLLYGPPAYTEPVQTLYGPPSIFDMKDNPMVARASDQTVKASRLVGKAKVFKKAIKVKKAKGAVRYKRVKKASSDELAVNKKTGAVTIAQGTEAGDYSIRVRITAQGNSNYRMATKTVTVKVHVK